jgi:hypothetical protein
MLSVSPPQLDCHVYLANMNEVDASSSSIVCDDDGEAVCYLCLDGDVDEAGQPLRRDCACRGTDAGFVHLSCLAKYAASKSRHARGMKEFIAGRLS